MTDVVDPETKAHWESYLAGRTGTYEFRCKRYRAVFDQMTEMNAGLLSHGAICDIGAGRQEFLKYCESVPGWSGGYYPVDGSIDGTDLEFWTLPMYSAFNIAIEVLEHLHDPWRLAEDMVQKSWTGAVITTPNPAVVDVLGMDPTHLTPISEADLILRGWSVRVCELFGVEGDSLLAWQYKSRRI